MTVVTMVKVPQAMIVVREAAGAAAGAVGEGEGDVMLMFLTSPWIPGGHANEEVDLAQIKAAGKSVGSTAAPEK